jgi:hypothetical protein
MPTYYIMDLADDMPTAVAKEMPSPAEIAACRWLPDSELAVYAGEYQRNGFQGGLNWYRSRTGGAFESELQLFSGRTIDQPSIFISGKSDWGVYQRPGSVEKMNGAACTNMAGVTCSMAPGIGCSRSRRRGRRAAGTVSATAKSIDGKIAGRRCSKRRLPLAASVTTMPSPWCNLSGKNEAMPDGQYLRNTDVSDAEWQARCELAALYHVCNHLGWTDLINTHMSARVPGEPKAPS